MKLLFNINTQYKMKNKLSKLSYRLMLSIVLINLWSLSFAQGFELFPLNNSTLSVIKFDGTKNTLLLPVQETAGEVVVEVIENNAIKQSLNVRLALDYVDYYMPLQVSKDIVVTVGKIRTNAAYWNSLKCVEEFEIPAPDKYRNHYHHAPLYGWMNDPNGMFYKDGEYHLYYQYNPYGAMWGNMHWAHSVSKDLVTWEHKDVAIAPDANGAIFSGSCIVDKDNTAGFGKDAVIAYYTSAKAATQSQSMSYSLDNGYTFTSVKGNPRLMANVRDFRDPKIVWYEATKTWIMALAAGQKVEFYSSKDLDKWTFESAFGAGEGCHDGVWECPDLIQVKEEGTGSKKWVLIVNINPGCPFGGSATQYFVGTFDGHKFESENPKTTKWMDYGKDHYATVSWSNVPDGRCLVIAWMSNWQYANIVPTKQYRSSNSIVRELTLYTEDGKSLLKCKPVKEIDNYAKKALVKNNLKVGRIYNLKNFIKDNNGAYEIKMDFAQFKGNNFKFELTSKSGDVVRFRYDVKAQKFYVDRTNCGDTGFSKDFPCVTNCATHGVLNDLRIFVDRSSVEVFGNDGKFVMTNIVFPDEALTDLTMSTEGGQTKINRLEINKIIK